MYNHTVVIGFNFKVIFLKNQHIITSTGVEEKEQNYLMYNHTESLKFPITMIMMITDTLAGHGIWQLVLSLKPRMFLRDRFICKLRKKKL